MSWNTALSSEGSALRMRRAESPPPAVWTQREVARALRPGQEKSLHRLTETLLPVVHARVARVLMACPVPIAHVRAEVEDLTQEVFAHLFENNARILRAWNPVGARPFATMLGSSLKDAFDLCSDLGGGQVGENNPRLWVISSRMPAPSKVPRDARRNSSAGSACF